ncbi:response regulator transcription factor [Amycolatopsis oliviviridis]|uniref:Helix-turn-helix transcriptional regulator n=1 Tax=Amycolatopsis oliviviridis TaxID=1471590 RepID=A0ABQ3LXX6_9PSEU|nr:response regulator transcription factor [Amycolatopsis oliviviridis]GHH28512.1 helix-turn-helix transcriptional regulator [Amycolatopsis oliviviridis]
MEPVRVGISAVDPITHSGLASFLSARDEMVVVDAAELTERDVLVVQVDRMTPQVMTELRSQGRELVPKVLVTGELKDSDVVSAVECRVVAVLPRNRISEDRLASAVLSAASGRGLIPPEMLGKLFDNIRRLQHEVLAPRGLGAAGLTAREVDVLRLMAEGRDTGEIAGELCYSERTVKNVVYELTSRLNLRNRPHAVAYAMQAGVI